MTHRKFVLVPVLSAVLYFAFVGLADAQTWEDIGRECIDRAAEWDDGTSNIVFHKCYIEFGRNPADHQAAIGKIYRDGDDVPQDYEKAAHWFSLAAEQGDIDAQYHLGYFYVSGRGVPIDAIAGNYWFRRAAEQTCPPGTTRLEEMLAENCSITRTGAQVMLGLAYQFGSGVPRDLILAHMWFNLAAANGDQKAKTKRQELEKQMVPEQIAAAQRLVRDWKPAAP